MSDIRIIKKYPNRRLYDTQLSRYITLADVRKLVMKGTEISVVDTNTDEDLTHSILLQIMFEEESGGQPLFTKEMLGQIIRFYGGTAQGMIARYLEESLSMISKQQQKWQETLGVDPLNTITKLAKRNMKLWIEMNDRFFLSVGFKDASKEDHDDHSEDK